MIILWTSKHSSYQEALLISLYSEVISKMTDMMLCYEVQCSMYDINRLGIGQRFFKQAWVNWP
jgi:putative component of membrane protein insertase Oxa1/YidC/SpoIIIJ protein YidD